MIDQVRSTIIEYLAGRFPANELGLQLPDPWELDEGHADDAARAMAMSAIGYLAETERGDRDEVSLRAALADLVTPATPALAWHGEAVVVESPAFATTQSLASKGPQAVPA
jgi:hypothetical protein